MSNGLEPLAEAVERAQHLLADYGDSATAPGLSGLIERLRSGDDSAVVSALSEATGSMGSLNDRWLCPENGDRISSSDVVAVNDRLSKLVRDIEIQARSVAAERGIHLVR
jgi:hypothetical protein